MFSLPRPPSRRRRCPLRQTAPARPFALPRPRNVSFLISSAASASTPPRCAPRWTPPLAAPTAEGAWDWKTAYDACEAATVLFLRKFGPAMRARAASPAALLPMLAKIAGLLPTHTRRSEESQALQQFSTPIALGFAASVAAAITPADVVLEPSAGTGLLAIFAELRWRIARSQRTGRDPRRHCWTISFPASP